MLDQWIATLKNGDCLAERDLKKLCYMVNRGKGPCSQLSMRLTSDAIACFNSCRRIVFSPTTTSTHLDGGALERAIRTPLIAQVQRTRRDKVETKSRNQPTLHSPDISSGTLTRRRTTASCRSMNPVTSTVAHQIHA